MIQKVGQIGVPVKELDKAIHFYKDKLGLSLLFIQIVWPSLNVTVYVCS
ncbi:hypothetical protein BACCIP111895_04611 [Neobacillus rhizosphaerae]|uniref:Glyoxalase/fosfomycin resistance/dioxygenase domain-containing protein n=1 Tax=Neobacillus rhizosphaerae TaxID=2880965 RepID=A0ABM9EXK3_9BACI|nr:hypothetical protein BACCIP111895_04611 [Neobacillus rhizosphaerae]